VVGRTSKMKGMVAEHLARRQAVLDYLGDCPDHQAKQSDIVGAIDLRMNGVNRKAFFEGLTAERVIEKVDSDGKALIWRLVS